tara:strand:+ start:600 stop:788 length:189 start_codon:yes stop_codon:yes gene_type:complete
MKYILFALVACGYLWVSNGSFQDEIMQENHYCEMVSIYESSGGENGWPNFKQINCKRGTENE